MRILIVLTNQKEIGAANKPTGFHFSEFTHPYEFFVSHGYDVTVGSPLGGECTITSPHPEDEINARFFKDPEKMKIIKETVRLNELKDKEFDAVYLAGGHGAMLDFPNNPDLAAILKNTIERGGVVAAICHGPAGFVGVKDKNGHYLVEGRKINSFTEEEEKKTPYYEDIKTSLEKMLREQGAQFESSGVRKPHLTVDGQIVTGQNPESIEKVTNAIHSILKAKS